MSLCQITASKIMLSLMALFDITTNIRTMHKFSKKQIQLGKTKVKGMGKDNKPSYRIGYRKLLLIWFGITLSSSAAFLIVAAWEISKRDFPQWDPFISTVPINIISDVFLPSASISIILFGIITGIIIHVVYFWFYNQSDKKKCIVEMGVFILLAGVLWVGIQWVSYSVQCKWKSLHNADLFGCAFPEPQYYQMAICVIWIIAMVSVWFYGKKELVIANKREEPPNPA